MNRLTEQLLEQPWVYRAWQAPFADQKFAPILAHNDLEQARKVLDIGCGPGTNAKYFTASQYLGMDINPEYIAEARECYDREYFVADVRTYTPPADVRFDFILVNSFLHHLNSDDVRGILAHVSALLAPDGYVHILELTMPANPSVSRLLARWDRGRFARPHHEWELLFSEVFEPVVFKCYPLTRAGVTLWNMVYFKGRTRK